MQRFITLALFLAAVNALLAIAGLFFPLASFWALADFLRKQNVETACCLIVGFRVYLKNSLRLHHGVFSAISVSENLDLAPLNLRFPSLN